MFFGWFSTELFLTGEHVENGIRKGKIHVATSSNTEQIEVRNFGTEEDKNEIKNSVNLEDNVKKRLIQMLNDYVEIFSWSNKDMLGLDTDIVLHRLPMKEGFPPIK